MEFSHELKRFEALQEQLSLIFKTKFELLSSHVFVLWNGTKKHTPKDIDLLILALIHGNEVAGLSSVADILEKIVKGNLNPRCNIAFALGNTEAGYKNSRFVEKDLNRVFGDESDTSLEGQRAKTLRPILNRSQFILDIHQTIESTTQPFFIFGFEEKSYLYAKWLSPNTPIVTYSIEERKSNGLVATSYAILNNSIAATIELGQKGFHEDQIQNGVAICKRALQLAEALQSTELGPKNNFVDENLKSVLNTPANLSEKVLVFSHREPNEGDSSNLHPGLSNFMSVKKGQKLGTNSKGDILAPHDGKILFPKYEIAKKGSKEIYVLLQEISLAHFLNSSKPS